MIAFFRFIKGYVSIKVEGFSPERFINLCGNKNILLWDIEKNENVYFMKISVKDFFKLRPIVKKTKTKVAVLEKYGLPFFIPKVLARKVFLIGLFAALFFWIGSSFFVWEITVSGNYSITEDKLKSFLAENNVYVGMMKKDLDIETVEKEMRKNFDIITWTSAKLVGTKLQITIKENSIYVPEENTETNYESGSDLTADVDGKIVAMIVRSGVPQVKIGQEVKTGDLLVSGNIPIYNEDGTVRKYRYSRSDADIYVEYSLPVNESIPFTYIKKEYTGRETKQYYIGWDEKVLQLPFPKNSFLNYDVLTTQKRITVLPDFFLPVIYGSVTYREYANVEHSYSLDEAEAILAEKYAKILIGLEEKGVQIIEKNVRIDTVNGKWVLTGDLRVQGKVGTEVTLTPMVADTEPENSEGTVE